MSLLIVAAWFFLRHSVVIFQAIIRTLHAPRASIVTENVRHFSLCFKQASLRYAFTGACIVRMHGTSLLNRDVNE